VLSIVRGGGKQGRHLTRVSFHMTWVGKTRGVWTLKLGELASLGRNVINGEGEGISRA